MAVVKNVVTRNVFPNHCSLPSVIRNLFERYGIPRNQLLPPILILASMAGIHHLDILQYLCQLAFLIFLNYLQIVTEIQPVAEF
jgi:hypothetical protein